MPTMDLPLSDLDSASSIGDSDLLYAVVEGVSKSITKQVLFNAVTQVLATKADLVQGILALSQMRENMKEVQNDTARFALTTNDVKKGFIIIVDEDSQGQPYSPNPKMYIVTDTAHLNTEAGYTPFASDVEWSTIENKPDNLVFSGTAVATETVAPIDPYLNASDVVNDLVTGGSDVPLSAEMGRTLNSSLTEKANKSWTYVDSKTGSIAIDLPNAWNEILITCNVHGETNRTTVVIPYELVSSNYNGFSFGNFGTSYFVGNVKTTSVVLTNANWGGTDVRTNTDVTVYYR